MASTDAVVRRSNSVGVILAAFLAVVTNWDEEESRTGRRGVYKTTGANMERIRELGEEEAEQVKMLCGAIGMDIDDEQIGEIFAGEFEYQISYSCNRFATKYGNVGKTLTANELRTLERARAIIASKQEPATDFLTRAA